MGHKGDNNEDNGNNGNMPPNKRFYKVAFSFTSGEGNVNRDFVRKVAKALLCVYKVPKELIFFDEWVGMEGTPSADEKFLEVYGKRSEYIVPFFCENYDKNIWTKTEGRAIQGVRNKTEGRVIPARFDKINDIEGFEENLDLFINCFSKSEDEAENVAKIIFNKMVQPNELIKLTHVNDIVHDLNNQKIKFGIKYIELRDIFIELGYENNSDHINLLQINSHKWEDQNESFNNTQLANNLAKVFDYIYDYSNKNKNIKILIKFLCTLRRCEILDDINDKKIESAITTACQNLDIEYDVLCSDSSDSSDNEIIFPFTNRKKELELIFTSKIKDQLITAPVSYGKKTFLEKLDKEFKKEGYVTFLKEITDQNRVASDNDLCRYFGFKNSEDFIKQKLTKEIERKIKDKGLVFLFITQNILGEKLKVLRNSVNSLRIQIKNTLEADNPNYQHHDNKLRLIVSSRQLYGDPRNEMDWPYGYESVWLSEFTDQVILDSLKENNFFSGKSEEEYTSIVARLTLLTAGHPALVKSTAENFKSNNSFNLIQIKDDINQLSQNFAASIKNAEVKNLFSAKKIPLYRYIDDTLLLNITAKSIIKCKEIFASLLSHGIYEKAVINGKPSKVIKDSLLRRTCAIDYCYQQADGFLISANNAKAFYFNRFDNGQCRLDLMILWLLESWYNDLQKKLLSFSWSKQDYNDKVGNINTNLFQEIPAHIESLLNYIKADNSKPEEGEKRLLERLEHDWEFKLLFSYLPYEPDTQCYSTDAYNELVSLIKETFAKQQGANHE